MPRGRSQDPSKQARIDNGLRAGWAAAEAKLRARANGELPDEPPPPAPVAAETHDDEGIAVISYPEPQEPPHAEQPAEPDPEPRPEPEPQPEPEPRPQPPARPGFLSGFRGGL